MLVTQSCQHHHMISMHGAAHFPLVFVRRQIGWYEEDPLQPKNLPHLFCGEEMPVMNGVKGTPQYTDQTVCSFSPLFSHDFF